LKVECWTLDVGEDGAVLEAPEIIEDEDEDEHEHARGLLLRPSPGYGWARHHAILDVGA
jgi:hypothetical protein